MVAYQRSEENPLWTSNTRAEMRIRPRVWLGVGVWDARHRSNCYESGTEAQTDGQTERERERERERGRERERERKKCAAAMHDMRLACRSQDNIGHTCFSYKACKIHVRYSSLVFIKWNLKQREKIFIADWINLANIQQMSVWGNTWLAFAW